MWKRVDLGKDRKMEFKPHPQGKLFPGNSRGKGCQLNYTFQECLGEGNRPERIHRYFSCVPWPLSLDSPGLAIQLPRLAQVQGPLASTPSLGRPLSPEPYWTRSCVEDSTLQETPKVPLHLCNLSACFL